jgi:hypothetical protein
MRGTRSIERDRALKREVFPIVARPVVVLGRRTADVFGWPFNMDGLGGSLL